MLKKWFSEQNGHVYWLATNKALKRLIENNNGQTLNDSVPLFSGEMFKSVEQMTPWVIPVTEGLLSVSDDVFSDGIGILSDASFDELVAHLRSLLIVGFEGEEILWRFYEPQILQSMLNHFEPSDLELFLGDIERLCIQDSDGFHTWDNLQTILFELKIEPWFRMKNSYLPQEENKELIVSNLESFLWQRYQTALDEYLDKGIDIRQLITQYIHIDNLSLVKRMAMAAIHLVYGESILDKIEVHELLDNIKEEDIDYALISVLETVKEEMMS